MRRNLIVVAIALLMLGACTTSSNSDSATTTPTGPPTSVALTAPDETAPASPAPTTTAAVTTTAPTTTTIAAVADLEQGLFCRDLYPLGYSYSDAVAYWVSEGSTDRMDADKNGIPCETVYPEADILSFWGDPLPTTTEGQFLSLAEVARAAAAVWYFSDSEEWSCRNEGVGDLGFGAIVSCVPEPIPEGQFPVLTGLVLNSQGVVAFAEAGVEYVILNPSVMDETMGSGLFCRDLLATSEFETELGHPHAQYFGALLYWFLEGRPDRMDADLNGIPCETLFPEWAVESVWEGGLFPIHAAG